MRIDSSLYSDLALEVDRNTRSNRLVRSTSTPSNKAPDDIADLSTSDDSVCFLESGIKDLPDVRQEKVAALRSSIKNNNYFFSAEHIADAMYREIASLPRVPQPE